MINDISCGERKRETNVTNEQIEKINQVLRLVFVECLWSVAFELNKAFPSWSDCLWMLESVGMWLIDDQRHWHFLHLRMNYCIAFLSSFPWIVGLSEHRQTGWQLNWRQVWCELCQMQHFWFYRGQNLVKRALRCLKSSKFQRVQ